MNRKPEIAYGHQGWWEAYSEELLVEYQQCMEEGKDIEAYRELFENVQKMPPSAYKARMADVLYELQLSLSQKQDYPYLEPDDLESIRTLRPEWKQDHHAALSKEKLEDQVLGAWIGRTCGCLLGKPIEGIRRKDLYPLLQESGNWPLHRYLVSSDISEKRKAENRFFTEPHRQCWADLVDRAPSDDDTNYTVLYQLVVERYGRDFTPEDVQEAWIAYQSKNAYCTAERVAYCNTVKGYRGHDAGVWQNPYREWIGAQIRGDYFGYINPGDPETAAEMAWRDASISHVKNGIYGEMFAAAMIAQAAVETDIEKIILAGVSQIPKTSRLYEFVMKVVDGWRNGMTQQSCHDMIHADWDENTAHGWCHTISNAMIVTMALLYGEGDYSKSICMAVETCFDTDCNGATVGSILGMRDGAATVGEEWTKPINGLLHTTIFGVGTVKLADAAKKTMEHMKL